MHHRWGKTNANLGRMPIETVSNVAGKGMGRTSNGMVKRRFGFVDFICLCLSPNPFVVDTGGLDVDTPVAFMLTHCFVDEEYILNC